MRNGEQSSRLQARVSLPDMFFVPKLVSIAAAHLQAWPGLVASGVLQQTRLLAGARECGAEKAHVSDRRYPTRYFRYLSICSAVLHEQVYTCALYCISKCSGMAVAT